MALTNGESGAPMIVGRSSKEGCGMGAFAGCKIEADRYIGEYVGELISKAESKRRSRIYDSVLKRCLPWRGG